jgi:hypothetical protein
MEFGKRKDIKRPLVTGLILVGIGWLPVSCFLVFVSIDSGSFETSAFSLVLIVVLGGVILRHLHELYEYPLVEINDKYMIVTAPFSKRGTYELSRIHRVWVFGPSVFFTYMGWPTFLTIRGLREEQVFTLRQVLSDS